MVLAMVKSVCSLVILTTAMPLACQVEPSASGGSIGLDDTQMMIPSPVSGGEYPSLTGSESRSNYLAGGLVVRAGYVDNLFADSSSKVSDGIYSIFPTISFDRRTPRQSESLSYSPGFQFYQKTSQYNSISQSASGTYRFNFTKYAAISLVDSFQQNSNLYNQGNPFAAGGVSGAAGAANATPIAPFANQLSNSSGANLNYQYAKNAMIGGSGTFAIQQYSQLSDVPGLNNGNTTGGSAFWTRRFGRSEYVGLTYLFDKYITHPVATYTVANTILGFYTHYFTRSFSFSVMGGPEHYTSWAPSVAKDSAWTPAVQGSLGWQARHASLAATFTHIVSGSGGLTGTYQNDTGGGNARVQIARSWNTGANAEYSILNSLNTLPTELTYAGGRTISAGAYLEYRMKERLSVMAGYSYMHQSYPNVPVASTFPNSNQVYVSVGYQISRPLGR
jgi:hypothetical protein